jgi:hypothetical protein
MSNFRFRLPENLKMGESNSVTHICIQNNNNNMNSNVNIQVDPMTLQYELPTDQPAEQHQQLIGYEKRSLLPYYKEAWNRYALKNGPYRTLGMRRN